MNCFLRTFFTISIVSILFSSCNDRQVEMSEDVADFFSNMPEGDVKCGENVDVEQKLFWKKFFALGCKSNDELKLIPPDIKPIMDFPLLLNGDTINEEWIYVRNRSLGEAYCINGKPSIRYYTRFKYIDDYCIAFFRMHEYAHFLLGHLECGKRVFPSPELEFEADKKAIELLEQFPDGDRIIDHARGLFLGMNTRNTSTHPSSVKRAKAFYDN
jgi:hypothetical protein